MAKMNEHERRKVIEYFIYDVYSPQLTRTIEAFMNKYSRDLKERLEYELLIGLPINTPKIQLDLVPIVMELTKNITNYEILIHRKDI